MTRQKEIRKTEYYQEQNLTTSLTTGPVLHAVSGRNTLKRQIKKKSFLKVGFAASYVIITSPKCQLHHARCPLLQVTMMHKKAVLRMQD